MDHSQDKTEEPTAKRLKEAKEAGDAPFSDDLYKGLFLLVAFLILWFFFPKHSFFTFDLQTQDPLMALKTHFAPLIPFSLILLSFFLLIVLLNVMQKGFLFAFGKKKVPEQSHKLYSFLFALIKMGALSAVTLFFLLDQAPLLYFPLALALVLVFFGVIDFLAQRHFWRMRMRMTRQEVLEEQRENNVRSSR